MWCTPSKELYNISHLGKRKIIFKSALVLDGIFRTMFRCISKISGLEKTTSMGNMYKHVITCGLFFSTVFFHYFTLEIFHGTWKNHPFEKEKIIWTNLPSWPWVSKCSIHPGRWTAGTWKNHQLRKENDLNQTSMELCSSRSSSGVYMFLGGYNSNLRSGSWRLDANGPRETFAGPRWGCQTHLEAQNCRPERAYGFPIYVQLNEYLVN